ERIGVRELRQHASRYLARVAGGETIQVTDRGRPVAVLAPNPPGHWQELVAAGQILPATGTGDVLDEEPEDYAVAASARLSAIRASER
ncbi:MAG TPA: type II toxin-antitoxin system prevent-host-death family antitoxin, partial [Acidimicrobiales bacterium]|nr:type II toxin-antitoxin system prevent-host-death family antitoxin [Acidimicrobiales bacterium]